MFAAVACEGGQHIIVIARAVLQPKAASWWAALAARKERRILGCMWKHERTSACPGAVTAVLLASWRLCGPLLSPGEVNAEVATR